MLTVVSRRAIWECALTSPSRSCAPASTSPSLSESILDGMEGHRTGHKTPSPPALPTNRPGLPLKRPQPPTHGKVTTTNTTASPPPAGAEIEAAKMTALAAGRHGAALVALLAISAASAIAAGAASADDFFSPLAPIFAPVINSICSTVACGKGNCTVAPGTLGYRCECDPGWTQLHVGDDLRFLPCVIPNCSIDSSCSNGSSAPAPTPLPPPKNFSLDPCGLAYCGAGGTCRNGSGLSYHCDCKEGYSNLLNITTMPCFRNCSIGADCSRIGILPFSNSSSNSPAPPGSESISNNGNAAAPGSISQRILLPLLVVVSLAVGQAI